MVLVCGVVGCVSTVPTCAPKRETAETQEWACFCYGWVIACRTPPGSSLAGLDPLAMAWGVETELPQQQLAPGCDDRQSLRAQKCT